MATATLVMVLVALLFPPLVFTPLALPPLMFAPLLSRAYLITAIGVIGMLAILYLMIFKPKL